MQPSALQKIASLVNDLPALPTVVNEALALLTNPDTEPDDLQQVLSRDPAISLKLMRLANSAYYRRKHEVSTLSAAIVLLGFRTIQTLILSSAVHRVLSIGEGSASSLWEHCLASALACREVSRRAARSKADPEEAFLAGLFHDTAKNVIAMKFPGIYSRPLGTAGEEELLGFHHGQLGQILLAKWEIPVVLADAVGSHHAPEPTELGKLTVLGDWLAWEVAPGVGAPQPPEPRELLSEVGIETSALDQIREHLAVSITEETGAHAA